MARNELSLQSKQEEADKADIRKIMIYSVTQFGIQVSIGLFLFFMLQNMEDKAKSCSKDVWRYLNFCLYYFEFSSLRALIVCFMIPCFKKPQQVRDISNCVFIGLDAILYTTLTIWGSMVVFDENTWKCRNSEDRKEVIMWLTSICFIVYGWVYVILLCCGLTSVPLLVIFWCVHRM